MEVNMNYVVDQINNNIVLLESLSTKEKKEIPQSSIPFPISESDIIILKDNIYYKDDQEKLSRTKLMKLKFNQAKSNK